MLKIIINDLKIFFRDKTVLFWSFLFPVILVVLLGNALNSAFPSSDNMKGYFEDVKIEYVSHADRNVTESFEDFLGTLQSDMDIHFKKSDSIVSSIEKVKNKDLTIAVEIKSNKNFVITKNRTFKSNLAEHLINAFVEKYNLVETVYKKGDPAFIEDVLNSFSNSTNHTELITLNRDSRDMSAMDYYGIANIFAMVFWMITSVLPVFNNERKAGLLGRIRIGGISKNTYIFSKYISISLFLLIEGIILLLFNVLFLNVYVGDSLFYLILLLVSTVMFVSAISVLTLAMFPKLEKGTSLLDSIIPVVVLLGGGITPILDFTPTSGLNGIAKFSPLFVQNKSAFALVNGGNLSVVSDAFIYNFSLTIIILIATTIVFKRKEEK